MLALVLTCCLTVYLIVAPFLYHRMAVAWPLVLIAALADAAAVGTLALTWLLRHREVADLDAMERLTKQTEQQLTERAERQMPSSGSVSSTSRGSLAELMDRTVTAAVRAGERQESMPGPCSPTRSSGNSPSPVTAGRT